jgi:group II intron reverse transcriptase/maturase
VSAFVAIPAEQDKVRELQRTLYRAAKADPGRRFHVLYDKVYRRDVLQRAWEQVRANRGAAGIDEITLADVEQYGVARLLDELAAELKDGSWRPVAARRVWIDKPGNTERRPLSIPTVRDRIVQTAAKIVCEPIFEADMLPCSFGFRPKKSAHDALQVLHDETFRGRRWVVETDIASCFEAIPLEPLMTAVEERICDRNLLKLLRAMLRVGALSDGVVHHAVTGTPQGGVVSPLLANVYLHRLDREWNSGRDGVLVRYADDLVAICHTRRQAERALRMLQARLAELGLQTKAAKTRIVHLQEAGEGLDFLGFHLRMVRARSPRHRHVVFLARWPSRKAQQHARDRLRFLTARARLAAPTEQVVAEVNRFLRGWAGYFRFGHSARDLDRIRSFAVRRLAHYVGYRHKQGFRGGWHRVVHASPDCMGIISLNGFVVAPRANKPWREKPNATW